MDSNNTKSRVILDDVAAYTVGLFPTLNLLEQRLSLELYRLLCEGQPVPRARLAQRLGIAGDTVNQILDGWPGVFSDQQRRIVGYWGLAIPAAYASSHRMTIGDQSLSAWCAWDTLFLPQLLGQTAEIESTAPAGVTIRLTVTPERLVHVNPAGAQMSFLLPDATEVQKDVMSTFCDFVHFFPSAEVGQSWAARHPGTFLLSIDEAHDIARRKNYAQYQEALRGTPQVGYPRLESVRKDSSD